MLSKVSNYLKNPRSEFIKVAGNGSAALITIDRQKALNAINYDMFKTLYYTLRDLESKKSHVIIKGAGERAFSAGGDIKSVVASPYEKAKDTFRYTSMNFHLVSTYKKPYVAIMDGLTMGGASVFSIAGKYKIATERTVYAMPETVIGFFNDAGASYFLSRLRYDLGIYLGMTAERLKGFDVKKVGLATHFVESKRLEDLEKALLECKTDEEVGKAIAKHSSVPTSTETELDLVLNSIDKCFDGETVEEIMENLHLDGSEWAMNTIRTLNKLSPTSLKVTHRCMTLGKKMSLEDCLKMEFRVGQQYICENDLKEGVRAALVDKDFKPNWDPKTLHEVTEDDINRFFQPENREELEFESR